MQHHLWLPAAASGLINKERDEGAVYIYIDVGVAVAVGVGVVDGVSVGSTVIIYA